MKSAKIREFNSASTSRSGRPGVKVAAVYSRTAGVISAGRRSRVNSVARAPAGPCGRACSHGCSAAPAASNAGDGGSTSTIEFPTTDNSRCRSVTWK